VSADEVRSAATFSSAAGFYPRPQAPAAHGDNLYPYPPSIHSAMISPSPSHAPLSPHPDGKSSPVLRSSPPLALPTFALIFGNSGWVQLFVLDCKYRGAGDCSSRAVPVWW
jgi:hypothetical protein